MTVAAAALVMAGYAYLAAVESARLKLEGMADDAIGRIETRLELHTSLLRATLALFKSGDGSVDRETMRSFVMALNIEDRYVGIRGIGFARIIRAGGEAAAESAILRNYGAELRVWPEKGGPVRAVVTLIEPVAEINRGTLGFDLMTDEARKEAIERAINSGQSAATRRLNLWHGDGPARDEPGFVVYLPLVLGLGDNPTPADRAAATVGVLYLPFRAAELFSSALIKAPLLPLAIEVFDGETFRDELLYGAQASPDQRYGSRLRAVRTIEFAGRKWTLRFQPATSFQWPTSPINALVFALFGLVLA
ncbi:MAG: CHASE domain-containing protein, partial [Mesorhizobium sp.]